MTQTEAMAGQSYEAALRHSEAGRFGEVVAICTAILRRTPRDVRALRLLGLAHGAQGAYDQSGYFLTAALAAMPADSADAVGVLNELAALLCGQDDLAAAFDCYRRALERNPRDVTTLTNYAGALVHLNRHAEALALYRAALAITPESAELRTNAAVVLLAMGRWTEGWQVFEARLSLSEMFPPNRFPRDIPRWRGEDITGKTILLQAEQGLGDTLHLVRYVPTVAARDARVVLRVQQDLGKVLAGFPGADAVVTNYDDVDDVDTWCPLMSLPLAFGTEITSIPSQVPYLQPPREYVWLWQTMLGLRRRPRIGIVWSARRYIPLRSMPLATLEPLLVRPDLEFHVLQKEIDEPDRAWLDRHPLVVDHSALLKDFADTAALISQLDLVLTIDTAVAHLAGAMARPVWLMLPFSADWRWLTDRTDTPWYPTARLFRQPRHRDWDAVVAEVIAALPSVSVEQ
jgi:tetratricopeptide (TPR) repeat protein